MRFLQILMDYDTIYVLTCFKKVFSKILKVFYSTI